MPRAYTAVDDLSVLGRERKEQSRRGRSLSLGGGTSATGIHEEILMQSFLTSITGLYTMSRNLKTL
jgi:hypothetical protein